MAGGGVTSRSRSHLFLTGLVHVVNNRQEVNCQQKLPLSHETVKISPDSLMQMVYQLSYYRNQGRSTPTYESASVRAFKHGRTETVRSCSVESVKFTEA